MAEPPPQNTIQVAGQTAQSIIDGFKNQPVLLMLVILNLTMFIVGYFFLSKLAVHISERDTHYIRLLERCIIETAPTHQNAPRSYYPDQGSEHRKEDQR